MSRTEVSLPTPDGNARAYVFRPDDEGPWPAVIFYMDAPAIRPALFDMCERLAGHGYFVLLPDMFWRAGPYEPINLREAFASEEARRAIFGKLMGSTNPEKSTRDTGTFLDWLETQPDVKAGKVGCTGYCMGASLALRAAGNYPERIAAAGGFHGGRLATDEADSPHLLAPKIKARVYIGGADDDAGFPPEQADRLRDALTAAGVVNTVEIYAGARHGYAPPDMPVYDEAASERHWRALLALLDGTLKSGA
ncbi:MAG TPA: dienelactone hydrolase family protein [Caulobacteraceae bacterium]